MSVYTSLSLSQLTQLLNQYELGEIISYEGISDGIENTNYQLKSTSGDYILTIFEQYKVKDLTYFLNLMAFLRSHGMNVPRPIPNSKQQILTQWQSKPAALFNKLPGQSILHPSINHCQQIGTALAQLHTIGQKFSSYRHNDWGYHWAKKTGKNLIDDSNTSVLNKGDKQLLSEELLFQQQLQDNIASKPLPQGIIHADLFCDNTLFEKGQLSGILDFYTACNGSLLYDLAITVNAWCLEEVPDKTTTESTLESRYLDFNKATAMIQAYERVRPLNDHEQQHWPGLLRSAGLRFWLSRLMYRQSRLEEAELTLDKDPDVLKCLLLKHRKNVSFCQSLCLTP